MAYILFALIFFIATVIIQILFHKVLISFGKRTFATIHVISVGCFVHAFIQYQLYQTYSRLSGEGSLWLYPVPITAGFLYVLLFFFYITYSASPYLGQEGPTSKILNLFRKHSSLSEKQVIATFTDQETVHARIDDLVNSGWIRKEGSYIRLQGFGRILARFILFYRSVLGLKSGG